MALELPSFANTPPMRTQTVGAAAAIVSSKPVRRRLPLTSRRFPGCRQTSLSRGQLPTWERRFEYWDGDTETAWEVREPTSATHEQPKERLAGLSELIAQTRGAPIACLGTMDLLLRGPRGEPRRILQADQSLYLYPRRAKMPFDGAAMVVDEHTLPDVVLEVDNTTDVRKGKLWFYEEWGFPELWVDVPEADYAVNRPAGLVPGLTIYLLDGGEYRQSPVSLGFPGWTGEEIHAALNEPAPPSPAPSRVIERVGRALGHRDGTGPDDQPWLRRQRRGAQRALLVRMAAARFDAAAASALSRLLRREDDEQRLAEVGVALVECPTSASLLARVEALGLDSRSSRD